MDFVEYRYDVDRLGDFESLEEFIDRQIHNYNDRIKQIEHSIEWHEQALVSRRKELETKKRTLKRYEDKKTELHTIGGM